VVALILVIGALVGLSSQPVSVVIEPDSVLVLDLNTTIQDAPVIAGFEEVLEEALGGGYSVTYLLKILDAIERAKTDDDIAALLLHGSLQQQAYGSGLAAVSEIREAIAGFKASGKPVYAYLVDPSQKDYYLASVADEIWLNPFGLISLNGLATEVPFLGGTLKKYGVGVQTTRVGAYKSAVEMFTREKMSEADREQRTALLNDLWDGLLDEISATRPLERAELVQLTVKGAFFSAEEAQAAKLVDTVGYLDELIEYLAGSFQRDELDETFRQVALADYANSRGFQVDVATVEGDRVAVVYAEGDIVDGGVVPDYVSGDWLAHELRRLRKDSEVKAVVLRVNSPGGSAVASEIIQRETRLLAETKPLIVSMGSYAASGGYWISAYADKIYAQPYTITGSIGVFGLVFNVEEMAANVALHFDGVKTAPFADIHTVSRPRTKEEMALIQKFTDEIYDAFIDKVAEGRSLDQAQVRDIAQGRVWSGARAGEIKLIDAIGGLQMAINDAANQAGLKYLAIEQVPRAASFAENLAKMLEEPGAAPVARFPAPANRLAIQWQRLSTRLNALNDPRGVYARLPFGFDGL
jgi:protease-4